MKLHDGIDEAMAEWIGRQPLFFVASAPLAGDGHVNLSPRGLDSFRVLDERRVAWLDLTGSGNETAAHLAENGRVTVMFCAFEGEPRILRLYGRGRVVLRGSGRWEALAGLFPALPGVRQIVEVEVARVQTSCGYGVPLMDYRGERSRLLDWAGKKGEEGVLEYRKKNNAVSIDGLIAPREEG
ncbi:pyridoxamine 5'-phosphate oxidase family protein [Endothiovibrio diazotrophicus]